MLWGACRVYHSRERYALGSRSCALQYQSRQNLERTLHAALHAGGMTTRRHSPEGGCCTCLRLHLCDTGMVCNRELSSWRAANHSKKALSLSLPTIKFVCFNWSKSRSRCHACFAMKVFAPRQLTRILHRYCRHCNLTRRHVAIEAPTRLLVLRAARVLCDRSTG